MSYCKLCLLYSLHQLDIVKLTRMFDKSTRILWGQGENETNLFTSMTLEHIRHVFIYILCFFIFINIYFYWFSLIVSVLQRRQVSCSHTQENFRQWTSEELCCVGCKCFFPLELLFYQVKKIIIDYLIFKNKYEKKNLKIIPDHSLQNFS